DGVAEAIKPAGDRGRIHTFIATSPIHMEAKLRMSPDEVVERAVAAVKQARNLVANVEFSAEDAGRSDDDFLCRIVEQVIDAGASVINIPDTVGYMTPDEFGRKIKLLRERVPNADKAIFSVHCHNDLGLAVANSLAAVENGARQVECTINGLGERAGNAALEEIVMILKTRADRYDIQTGIDTTKIVHTSKLVSQITGMPIQANKAIVGANAFAHSSGIHQDGVLKNRENYEIIDPVDVGISQSSIVLTARSGRAALKHRLEILGVKLSKKELDEAYDKFLNLADKKKDIKDEDLLVMLSLQKAKSHKIKLKHLQVISGTSPLPTAIVQLDVNGETLSGVSTGNGPIDACFTAVKKILKKKVILEEFLIQAITRGSDDLGKVHVQIKSKGVTYYGFSANTDIITASVEAFIDAIEKANGFAVPIENEQKETATINN
ncbi:MAG: 2-isopropylmalate synthase, partial [Bacteroidales bacterium]|nr:2-isopropylmalate synthase [Bacteroidales bacterium]